MTTYAVVRYWSYRRDAGFHIICVAKDEKHAIDIARNATIEEYGEDDVVKEVSHSCVQIDCIVEFTTSKNVYAKNVYGVMETSDVTPEKENDDDSHVSGEIEESEQNEQP
jgi:hypothetical protein